MIVNPKPASNQTFQAQHSVDLLSLRACPKKAVHTSTSEIRAAPMPRGFTGTNDSLRKQFAICEWITD